VFQSSRPWLITESESAYKVFEVAELGQRPPVSVADSTLAAVAKETGITAVSSEKRLPNLFNKTYPKLGVPIRRVWDPPYADNWHSSLC
jgi:predicted nucleic acid-binding protein